MNNDLFKIKKSQLKQNKNKGFTLVEVIVVIVIIAILAGIAVPALTGYINKAKERSAIAECRQAVVAAQAISSEMRGTGQILNGNPDPAVIAEIVALSEIPASGVIDHIIFADSVVSELQYTNDGVTVLYKNGEYTIIDGSAGSPSPAPPAPAFSFTSVADINDITQRVPLIKENARELVALAENAMNESLASLGATYMTSTGGYQVNRGVDPNKLDQVFLIDTFDANGAKVGDDVHSDFANRFIDKINSSGANIGYSSILFSDMKYVNSQKVYTTKVTSITFKGYYMTGSQQDEDKYTYNVATGELKNDKTGAIY